MPCLILTGHPCSGKTTLAQLIKEVAEQDFNVYTVVLGDDEVQDRDAVMATSTGGPGSSSSDAEQRCATPTAEKQARARLKSEFDRLVSRKAPGELVVVDSMNYIKGFRYELYCISKAAQERHGVVWVLSPVELVRAWNSRECRYPEAILTELMQRYEPPDDRNRWDSPLFRVDLYPDEDNGKRRGSAAVPEGNVSSKTASQVLERSVYDMHRLSSVLNSAEQGSSPSTEAAPSGSTTSAAPPMRAKRAVFKRPNRAMPSPAEAPGGSPHPTPDPLCDSAIAAPQAISGEDGSGDPRQPSHLPLRERVRELLGSFLSDAHRPLRAGASTARHEGSGADALHALDAVTLRH